MSDLSLGGKEKDRGGSLLGKDKKDKVRDGEDGEGKKKGLFKMKW
jgi:hypothetical protein